MTTNNSMGDRGLNSTPLPGHRQRPGGWNRPRSISPVRSSPGGVSPPRMSKDLKRTGAGADNDDNNSSVSSIE